MSIQDGLKLEPTFSIPYYGLKGVEIPDVGRDDLAVRGDERRGSLRKDSGVP